MHTRPPPRGLRVNRRAARIRWMNGGLLLKRYVPILLPYISLSRRHVSTGRVIASDARVDPWRTTDSFHD